MIEYAENNSQNDSKKDCTGGIVDSIKDIIDFVLKDFEQLTETDKDKKSFIKDLIKIFAILLSTKCNSLQKIKKIIKLSTEIGINLWPEQKQR